MPDESKNDLSCIAIVGGGLSGGLAANLLAHSLRETGTQIVWIAPHSNKDDRRTTAILMPGIGVLDRLGLWERLEGESAPLRTMRIVDSGDRLISVPSIEFRASEIGQNAFGYNIPNRIALETFENSAETLSNLRKITGAVSSCTSEENSVVLETENGETVSADLVVAADGRRSMLRASAKIDVREWTYPQTALVTTFSHSLPHNDVSTELHTSSGPFTQVPLPPLTDKNNRSSLVWVVEPDEVHGLLALTKDEIAILIEEKLQSSLGKVELEVDLQSFSLSCMAAKAFARNRIVLIGEAAHVMPPIGAQGFNLGVNDILELERLLLRRKLATEIVREYDFRRRAEVTTKIAGVDGLNRSLLTGFLPVHLGRATVLGVLDSVPILRRSLMNMVMNGPSGLFRKGRDRPGESRS